MDAAERPTPRFCWFNVVAIALPIVVLVLAIFGYQYWDAKVRPETFNERGRLAALRDGHVHILQLNTGAVPAAVNLGGFVPLVAPADESGRYQYEMELIVPADSPWRSLADFQAECAAAKSA